MKLRFLPVLLTLSFAYSATFLNPVIAAPPPVPDETKLTAPDAGPSQQFGRAVAVQGDLAVVGAPYFFLEEGTRAAYVFVRSSSGWQFQQKLTASDASPQSNFGVSVAIDGDTIVVGDSANYNAGEFAGAAYVFVRSGNIWTQQQKLIGSENSTFDAFGLAVGIKGNTIVCGAFGNSGFNLADVGSVYVFTQTSNGWIETQKLEASDADNLNRFGGAVAIGEETIVVGATGNGEFGLFSGAIYVFTFDGSSWVEQKKLHAQDASPSAAFGYQLGISEDTIVAASRGYVDTATRSAVYIFRRTPSGWHQQKRIVITDAGIQGQYELTAAVSGETVVIGSASDFTVAPYAGSAYIYRRNGASSWTLDQKILASDAARDDSFGCAVAVSGNTVLVGAFQKSGVALFGGAAYIFDFDF